MPDFPLPKGAALVAASPTPLAIRGEGVRCVIRPGAEGQRQLAAVFPTAAPPQGQVYLLLEHLRGTRDATVLNVYIQLPEGTSAARQARWLAGSAGLFGLRLASIRHTESAGQGLTFLFDITHLLAGPPGTEQVPLSEIHVSIQPNHPLPASSDLVVECVSLYRVPA